MRHQNEEDARSPPQSLTSSKPGSQTSKTNTSESSMQVIAGKPQANSLVNSTSRKNCISDKCQVLVASEDTNTDADRNSNINNLHPQHCGHDWLAEKLKQEIELTKEVDESKPNRRSFKKIKREHFSYASSKQDYEDTTIITTATSITTANDTLDADNMTTATSMQTTIHTTIQADSTIEEDETSPSTLVSPSEPQDTLMTISNNRIGELGSRKASNSLQQLDNIRRPVVVDTKISEVQLERLGSLIKIIRNGSYNEFLELLEERRGFKNLLNVFVDGQTALHYSLIYGRSLAWCKQLVLNGANPNLTNRAGWHPIHLAAFNGSRETMRYLIDCIAN